MVRFLMLQPLFSHRENSWYPLNMRLDGPLNQAKCYVEMKIICTDEKFHPDFLAHNLVTIPHILINTLFIYLFIWLLNMSAHGKEPKNILTTATEQNRTRVKFFYGMPSPSTESISPSLPSTCAHYFVDEGGWDIPKVCTETYMKNNWIVTEMFKIK